MPFSSYKGGVELDEYESVLNTTQNIITRIRGLATNSESGDTLESLYSELIALYPSEKIFHFTYTSNKEQMPALVIALREACDFIKSMERSNAVNSKTRADYFSMADGGYEKLSNFLEYSKAVYLRYVQASL